MAYCAATMSYLPPFRLQDIPECSSDGHASIQGGYSPCPRAVFCRQSAHRPRRSPESMRTAGRWHPCWPGRSRRRTGGSRPDAQGAATSPCCVTCPRQSPLPSQMLGENETMSINAAVRSDFRHRPEPERRASVCRSEAAQNVGGGVCVCVCGGGGGAGTPETEL